MSNPEELIRSFLLSLGENNQKRWKRLTADYPMTQKNFMQRLLDLKYSRDPAKQALAWDIIHPEEREMTFRDFVRFIQSEPEQRGIARPKLGTPKTMSVIDSLTEQRMELLGAFLQEDSDMLGYTSQRKFTDEAIKCGAVSTPQALFSIIEKLDPENTGKINYFQLLYILTSHLDSQDEEMPKYDSYEQSPEPAWTPGGGPRKNLDPELFGSPVGKTETDRNPRARTNLDPDIFGKRPDQVEHEIPNGGRGQLDPAIFGERPTMSAVAAAPAELIDFEKTRDCTDFNFDQTISFISRFANQKYRSIRDCFGCWRGTGDRLTGEDIFRAIAKEGGVELPHDIVIDIAKNFGTELTVSSFTRLITEGARIDAPEPVKAAPVPLTHEETILSEIAAGLKGKPWEPQIKYSKNALDLSRNLKKLGVTIKSEELRGMFEEIGMKEIINKIKVLQKPKKKRG